MKSKDEPMLNKTVNPDELNGEKTDRVKQIKELVKSQSFLVLCTKGKVTPYGSLLAYAPTEDFKYIYFATLKTTRKYELLEQNKNIALVIDNRNSETEDMMKIQAVTITGKTIKVEKDDPEHSLGRKTPLYGEIFTGVFLCCL